MKTLENPRPDTPFKSFLMGGLECSSHRLAGGQRLDLLHATRHEELVRRDLEHLRAFGIRTVRSGVRWHRVEREPGRFDFGLELPLIRAAEEGGTQVIWDLFHYGWPDFLDIFSGAFVEHFAALAQAFAEVLRRESRPPYLVSPVNEISFFAWAAGERGFFYPFARDRGDELKAQMVRAYLAAARVLRRQLPGVRLVSPEPVIHIVPGGDSPQEAEEVAAYLRAQYDAWNLIAGRMRPELGGRPEFLDILGLNFYPKNQWVNFGRSLRPADPRYRPFREMLKEVHERFGRPLLVAETGTEGRGRARWLEYVAGEVGAALGAGVPVQGLCWYPILDYPGWDDARHCRTGLLGYADAAGERPVYRPLARAMRRYAEALTRAASQSRADPTPSAWR